MVRRSHKRRKRQVCGHLGYGRWCHRCDPIAPPKTMKERSPVSFRQCKRSGVQMDDGAIARRQAKQQWRASFRHDPIPLAHLPKPVVLKTRHILRALEQGTPPGALHGKRFQFDRTLVRIPVTYRYRLLCRWQQDKMLPLMVLSHEAYNAIARHKKRVRRA